MEYTGLLQKHKVNRPPSSLDRENQLHQEKRLNIKIGHELTVIEINSSYLEVVDKFFFWKGGLTTACSLLLVGIFVILIAFLRLIIIERSNEIEAWLALLFACAVFSPLIWLFTRSIHKEINLTHYPIRFNRNTRKIHVFRLDGSVLTANWDQVFFTQSLVTSKFWEFQGHILAEDRETVLETFALPILAAGPKAKEDFKGYWEFIRRYMEEGPASVIDVITGYLPIKQKKETLAFCYHRVAFSLGSTINPLMLLYYIMYYPGRIPAMHYSKIPQWPREIEEQCPVNPNDPYFKDASSNPK
ncbi:DUF6708 domain-containing protein [Chromobacterium haemolyticum]|uniref:DUF6708 domain-containing protein n=1 Tax=Chromobacterium haemolyticum TaxID=394935 RepID=UPI0009F0566B|nr:DUF6708 domain-containing protein [Chromobacterium haemolyticum]OQS43864.1 hypothetical protein B0T39_02560 [Chromobacterium haemolyticum]